MPKFKRNSNSSTYTVSRATLVFVAVCIAVLIALSSVLFGATSPTDPGAVFAASGGTIAKPVFGVNNFQTGSQTVTASASDPASFTVELPANENYYNTNNTTGLFSNYEKGYEVAYSIYNPDIAVTFIFNATVSASCNVTLAYRDVNGNIVTAPGGAYVQSSVSGVSGQVSLELRVAEFSGLAKGDTVVATVTPVSGSVTVSGAKVTITSAVNAASASVVGNSVALTVSGTNRSTVSYSNINYGNTRTEINNKLFVKPGDEITLSLAVTYSADQTPVDFHHSFTAAFGYFGENSSVFWRTFVGNNPNSTTSYLRFKEGQTFYKGDDSMTQQNYTYFGYNVTFVVQQGAANASGGVLNIVPLFPSGMDENGDITFFNQSDLTNTSSGQYIALKVDASSPSAPVISSASALGQTISSGGWYTASNSIILDYSNASFDSTAATYASAEEQVYAFIVRSNTSNSNISITNYDFTPSNNPSDPVHNLTYQIGTQQFSATRQQLGVFTNETQVGKSALVFNEPGTWGLVLAAVDSAGNVSGFTLYSSANTGQGRGVVKIDNTKRNVYALFDTPAGQFQPGSNTTAYNNYTRYANVYVFAGADYHDVNGVCNVAPGVPTDDFSADRRAYSTVRVNYITVRIILRPDQYNYYEITGYTMQGGSGSYSITLNTFTEGGTQYKYLDITLSVTDMWWSDSTELDRPIIVYFRQRINIQPNNLSYTYTSRPIAFDIDSVTITAADTGNRLDGVKPSLGVNYYKELTLTYYSNASGGNITTGGWIELADGTRILEVPSGTSMNSYTSAGTVISFEDSEYYVFEAQNNWTGVAGNDTLATRSFYALDLSAASSEGYIDAGNYFYRIYVNASTESDYYGETIGRFYIDKAAPAVNGVHVVDAITYLDSLDAVKFASYTSTNVIIAEGNQYNVEGSNFWGTVEIEGVTYYLTAGGVYGTYRIISPAQGSAEYLKPQGGTLNISVEFMPVDLSLFSDATISKYFAEFFNYFYTESATGGSTVYTLKSGGKHYGNYASVRYNLTVTVNPKQIYLDADAESVEASGGSYVPGDDGDPGTFVYEYDGLAKQPYFNAFLEIGLTDLVSEEYTLYVEFKSVSEGDGSYSINYPSIAGEYDVRVVVNPRGGNYTSETYLYRLRINKQLLTVTLDPNYGDAGFTGELVVEGETYPVNGAVNYVLGHLETASYVYTDVFGNSVSGLQTVYSVWRSSRFDYDGNPVAAEDPEYVAGLPIIASNAFGAGIYLLYAEISNDNYYGGVYVQMTVEQASSANGLNVTIPTLEQNYANVSLDGTTRGTGHMEYGLTLAWATDNVIDGDGIVRYDMVSGATMVSGRFFFENETEYAERVGNGYVSSVNGNPVLDVLYYNDGNRIMPHTVRIFWQAGSYDDNGVFVPDYNYATYAETVNIYVVRATADFSEMRLSDLVYGQAVKEAKFEGTVSAGGYVFAPDEYSLTVLSGMQELVLSGGERQVDCMFVPGRNSQTGETDPEFTKRYMTSTNAKIGIFIEKRHVGITFVPSGDLTEADLNAGDYSDEAELSDAVYRTFGTRYDNPDVTILPVPVHEGEIPDAVPSDSVTISFTYYILKPEGYVGDGEIFEYDSDGDGVAEEYVAVTMNGATEAGRYYVLVNINTDNYSGEAFGVYFVIKAELNLALGSLPEASIEYLDDIASVDFGSVSLTHAPAGGVASSFTGTFTVYYVDESGTEYSSYVALPVNEFDESGLSNTLVRFTPAADADSYYRNFRPFESDYRLVVTRKDISSSIVIAADEDSDDVLSFVFNNRDRVGSDIVATASYADEVAGDVFTATFVYEKLFGSESVSEVKNAGEYVVTAVVEDNDRFCGEKSVSVIISPSSVSVEQLVPDTGTYAVLEQKYNGSAYSFVPVFGFTDEPITGIDTSNFAYKVSYSYYTGATMSSAPVNIGRYIVKVELNEQNYALVGMSSGFVQIVPDVADIGNALQTYAPPDTTMRIEAVYPIYNPDVLSHPSPAYDVKYEIDGVYSYAVPTESGSYNVKIVYTENGLSEWSYDGVMKIEPYAVVFSFPEAGYSYGYTGSEISLASKIELPHNITAAEYKYFAEGVEIAGVPVDAGEYEVTVTLTDPNYSGEGRTTLTVTPAAVRIMTSLGSVDVPFNTSVEDVNAILQSRLENVTVVFETTGAAVKGVFTLADGTDISGYRVGIYSVDITFRPESQNFLPNTVSANVNIIKKDLSDYIVIDAEILEDEFGYYIEREYSGSGIAVRAKLSDEGLALIMKDYGAVSVSVFYDNSSVAPVEVGEYVVTAEVNDSNYGGYYSGVISAEGGETRDLTLRVEKCAPRLELDGISYIYNNGSDYVIESTYPAGLPFTVSNIYSNSIFAYRGLSDATVSGKWVLDVEGGEITFDKANENYVGIWFEPTDQDRYVSVYATLKVMVNKTSVDNLGASVVLTYPDGASSAGYGVSLGEIGITLADGSPASEIGSVAWADPDFVPGVGEAVEYVFTPFEEYYDTYNVTRGKVIPVIDRAPMSIEAFAYIFTGAEFAPASVHIVFRAVDAEGNPVEGVEYTVTETTGSATGFKAGGYLDGVTAEVRFSHPNYVLSEAGVSGDVLSLRVFAYTELTGVNHSSGKYYDGIPADMEALELVAIGSEYVLGYDDYKLVSLKKDGVEIAPDFSNMVSAGVYTVTVEIFENGKVSESGLYHTGTYFGRFTFDYTIERLDLSDCIRVSGNHKTYAEDTPLTVTVDGYDVDDSYVSVQYLSFDRTTSYGALQPANAGSYWVVVSLTGNDYYTGSREFEYVVYKRNATATFIYPSGSLSYTFEYNASGGYEAQIQVSLSNNLTSKDYKLYYIDPTTGNRFESGYFPGNIGTYTVVVEIDNVNYQGSASATVTIVAAAVTIESVPSLSDIIYGSNLGSSRVTGGVALSNSREVKGTFTFSDPSLKPEVGRHSVTMIFVPDSSNYSSVQCLATVTVNPSPVSLELLTNLLTYNGEHQIPALNSTLSFRYSLTNAAGATVYQAINAGVYRIHVEITDPNYVGETDAEFTIQKAKLLVGLSEMPSASPVRYGASLSSGTFSGGSMVYVSGKGAVSGTFSYVTPSIVLGDVGVYEGVEFKFEPNDSANYDAYYGTLSVEVIKTVATIYVAGNTNFVYGDAITSPVFTTSPANMTVINDEAFADFASSVPVVGTYPFKASISDKNYEGEVSYVVTITKRPLGLSYYIVHEGTTSLTESYVYYYGSASPVVPRINSEDMLPGDESQLTSLQSRILVYYYPAGADPTGSSGSLSVPSAVADYVAVATMDDANYYLAAESASISYSIRRGTVSSISFDHTSLSTQIYGSVTMPTVVTSPAGVNVVVRFEGYDTNVIPTAVGEYTVTAEVVDSNYMPTTQRATFRILPKEISIENLRAYGKAYDGLPDIEVTGTLGGVLVGDEVTLHLTATTKDGVTEVGTHQVILTGWSLSGLHAGNYTLREPVYALSATISTNTVSDPATDSYITSEGGFSSNITVSFSEIYDTVNATNLFTRLFGQKATVQVIEIKENGLTTVLKDRVKFYVRIPDEYLECKNLVVEGLGNLADVTGFTREGNYITFYANSSGEIVFYTNDFPYWVIIVIAVVAIIILGAIVIFITAPIRKRKRVSKGARKIYGWRENSGSVEEAYKRKVKAQIEERKRKWRY